MLLIKLIILVVLGLRSIGRIAKDLAYLSGVGKPKGLEDELVPVFAFVVTLACYVHWVFSIPVLGMIAVEFMAASKYEKEKQHKSSQSEA